MSISQELLYLLLLYAVLSDGKLDLTTGLLIAFAIILLGPCLNRLCCGAPVNPVCPGTGFSTINNI